jgi:hypothetical protein
MFFWSKEPIMMMLFLIIPLVSMDRGLDEDGMVSPPVNMAGHAIRMIHFRMNVHEG